MSNLTIKVIEFGTVSEQEGDLIIDGFHFEVDKPGQISQQDVESLTSGEVLDAIHAYLNKHRNTPFSLRGAKYV